MSSESKDEGSSRLGRESGSSKTPQPDSKEKIVFATFSDTSKDEPRKQPAKYADLADKLDFSGLLQVHQKPCGREGLIIGIGGGAVVGLLRFVFGARIPKSANWAVGTFVVGGVGGFEFCKFKKRQERARVRRVIEMHESELRKAREAAAAKIEEVRLQKETRFSWYKFWR